MLEGTTAEPALRDAHVDSDIPARLDALPWSRFHWTIVLALGITWVLDGLETTIVGSIGSALRSPKTLGLGDTQIGAANSAYLAGAVIGALVFGRLTDRIGRKRLFFVTLGVYLAGTLLSACAWDIWSYALFRAITGAGIGGEYAAINSAVDELIPARTRGVADLAINGSYWIGAALGALGSLVVLDPAILPERIGWRAAFAIGGILGLAILGLRRFVPESPRWLLMHGRAPEAEAIVRDIEERVGIAPPGRPHARVLIATRGSLSLREIAATMLGPYRRRTLVALSLMIAQAFFYNAIFFTYALVLTEFYGVPGGRVGLYLVPFAVGNFLGPLVLGRFFDSVGRRTMIAGTYALSGLLLAITGLLFVRGVFDATTQTLAWSVIFFVASAAASSAYLTVSETFSLELRALAIAVVYAVGTGVGGTIAPVLFGALIATHARTNVLGGYLVGAAMMLAAAFVQARYGTDAERKSLEAVALALSQPEKRAAALSDVGDWDIGPAQAKHT